MKISVAFCLLVAPVVEPFTVHHHPSPRPSPVALDMSYEDQMKAWEHSLDTDPVLNSIVEHKHKKNPKFMDSEEHHHDSLAAEIEHAVFNDPDLANIVSKKKEKTVNREFMTKEEHVHDSLFNEVAHSVDNDSYIR